MLDCDDGNEETIRDEELGTDDWVVGAVINDGPCPDIDVVEEFG